MPIILVFLVGCCIPQVVQSSICLLQHVGFLAVDINPLLRRDNVRCLLSIILSSALSALSVQLLAFRTFQAVLNSLFRSDCRYLIALLAEGNVLRLLPIYGRCGVFPHQHCDMGRTA